MDLNHILSMIEKESDKHQEEILSLIKKKKEELSGLVSDIGAAHIVANELGVKLFYQQASAERKIKDLAEGMNNVEVNGRVTRKFEPREFQRGEQKGAVGNIILEDETAEIRVTFWNDLCQHLDTIKQDDIINIKGAYIRRNEMMNRNELHLSSRSTITVNPEGIKIEKKQRERAQIKDVTEENKDLELFGTIINVFNPTYFEVCPTCNKRTRDEGQGFKCAEHGIIQPAYSYVLNIVLDDGTGGLRVTCFRDQAKQLIPGIAELKGDPDKIDGAKVDLLGKMVIIAGRSTRNQMNNNIECIAQNVNTDVNPDEELQKLEKTEQ